MQIPTQVQAQSSSASLSETKPAGAPATQIIPSFGVAERYDSNVFFVPGTNLEDYVTTFSPQLKVNHRNQWVQGMIGGGATGEVFAKNSRLNYVGANGTVGLNFDGALNSLIPGLGLRVTDTFAYSPQLLPFGTPTGGNQVSEAFVPGIQAQRANSLRNAAKVEASYFFSSFMGVTSTYTDQRIRFEDPIAAPTGVTLGGGLRDTNFHTLNSGIVVKPSPADTILLAHQYQKGTFSVLDEFGSPFSTQGAIVRWSRSITPTLQVMGEGGFAVISPSNDVQSLGAASLEWKEQYTTLLISYSRSIAPSFLFASTSLLSQAVTGTVRRQIAEPLSLSLQGSYATNESVPESSLLQFQSYAITPSINYVISKTVTAVLSYTHSQFEQTFASQKFPFDRDLVQLGLTAEWK